jgi:hypothetical protein
MSCSNSSSKCNPCGPSEDAMNAIANRANYYARVAQLAADQVAQFNTVYLGAKATAPTVDNSGNPLIVGALYFNTTDDTLYTWDGSIWVQEVTLNSNQTITGQKTFTQNIIASAGVTGNLTGSVSGNATTATTLATGRTIAISGAVTGTATSFNGSANITIPATITSGATITSPALAGTATGSLTSTVLQGITNGVAATAGFVGEVIESIRVVGTATVLTSGVSNNAANITLTAGEWYINGQVDYRAGATTSITILTQGISTASGTLGAQDTFSRSVFAAVVPTAANDIGLPIRGQVLSLTATTTVYLVTNATFTASTLSAYGTITARRIR